MTNDHCQSFDLLLSGAGVYHCGHMAGAQRGQAILFFQAQFQRFHRQLHAGLSGEKPFAHQGVGCVAQQCVFKILGVHPADIDLFDQPAASGDVVGRQPSWQWLPQAMAQAECTFGPTDQIFQGQLGQAHGGALHDADGPGQAGGGQKSQLDIIGCKLIHALLHGDILLELSLVGAHLPVQRVGGIGVDVADAIQVGLAFAGLFGGIQGKAVMAIACDAGR